MSSKGVVSKGMVSLRPGGRSAATATLLFQDNFTDSDGTSLLVHTPDVNNISGTDWEQFQTAQAEIQSNRAVPFATLGRTCLNMTSAYKYHMVKVSAFLDVNGFIWYFGVNTSAVAQTGARRIRLLPGTSEIVIEEYTGSWTNRATESYTFSASDEQFVFTNEAASTKVYSSAGTLLAEGSISGESAETYDMFQQSPGGVDYVEIYEETDASLLV